MPTLDRDRLAAARAAANADDRFCWLARGFTADVLFVVGDRAYLLPVRDGKLGVPTDAGEFQAFDLRIAAPEPTWERLLSSAPPPLYHDLVAAWLQADLDIEGDVALALRYIGALRRFVALLSDRERPTGEATLRDHGAVEAPVGRYVWVEQGGRSHRLYYECAGEGDVPLVCLHTAGADSRQWRHLLADEAFRERFTMYAFDMPSHGRSFPPMDADATWRGDYDLTTARYRDLVMAFVDALGISNPAVLGCSMGGAIVLELAAAHGADLRGVVGVESTDYAPPRDLGYIDHPTVDSEVVRAEWVEGLQSPESPEMGVRESWWVYAQGGPGVYVGDLGFYAGEWDGRERVREIDTNDCPVYLLTGEYDYSALPEATERVAGKIPGAEVAIMDDLGHFPMVENYPAFRSYLEPALEAVAAGVGDGV